MEELDLKELLYLFWSKKVYVLIITAIFIVIGVGYSFIFVKPEYLSYTSLLLAKNEQIEDQTDGSTTTSGITQTDITLNQKLISTYSELVTSKTVVREVLNNLKNETGSPEIMNANEDTLKNKINVTSVKDTELLKITVKNADPEAASLIANEAAQVFIKKVNEIYNINNVHIVDKAEVDRTPSNINHAKDIVIFAFIGLVVSAMLILVMNLFNSTIKSSADVEKAVKLPVLAEIPKYNPERSGGRK